MLDRKNIIRIGDYVKIINPEIFLRCGYPLSKKDIKESFTDEQKRSIWKMLECFDIKNTSFYDNIEKRNEKLHSKILDEISYRTLISQGFGGKERKLYTKKENTLLNVICRIKDRKVVKTGKYVPGSGPSYFDYYECEPPSLDDQKTHVLFEIYVEWWIYDEEEKQIELRDLNKSDYKNGIWIEKSNLEKYEVQN